MTRVLIAVDGSSSDQQVAAGGYRLFGRSAEYLAVNVAESYTSNANALPVPYGVVFPYVAPVSGELIADESEQLERAEDVARRVAEDIGIEGAEAIGVVGDPGEAIVSAAERHEVDVIVVGSHPRSWFSRLVTPSVSSDVMAASTVPVLVVKPAD